MARTYHPRLVLVDGYRVRKHPSYSTWFLMLQRCTNPLATGFKNYGGRGIKVDPEWHHFANFARDVGIRPGPEFSIDRIDNDGNYCKANCRWALRSVQNSNKRVYSTNVTGVSGIRLRNGKYQVRIIENRRRISLGNYITIEEAVAAKKARTGGEACPTQG